MNEIDKLKQRLFEAHERRVGHMSPIIRGTAIAHYMSGVQDALDWVRDFNNEARANEQKENDIPVAPV